MTYVLAYDDNSQDMYTDFYNGWYISPPADVDSWSISFNGGNDRFFGAQILPYAYFLVTMALFGGDGVDSLMGGYRNDTIDGGSGADLMYESVGDDLYIIDNIEDQVLEYPALEAQSQSSTEFPFNAPSSGIDTVQSSVEFVLPPFTEHLLLTGTLTINGFGNAGRNSITGNYAANVIDGGLGIDTMSGGAGDDVFVVESSNDLVIEFFGQGVDLVEAWVSYSLPDFVEQGFLASAGRNQSLTGNTLGNLLVGNSGMNILSGLDGKDELRGEGGGDTLLGGSGIDTLDGGAGADRMEGGTQNDIYHVDSGLDLVIELADGGYDTVFTSTAIALPDHVEKLVFNGLADGTMLSGNDLANFLVGNYTDDIIDVGAGSDSAAGGSGDDTLLGGGGNDTLLGEFGIDSIEGGLGRDILIGGAGADLFVFVAVTDSAGTNRDLIRDFEDGLDRIDLRRMDAGAAPGDQALAFIGDLQFTAAGQVRVTTTATATRIEVSIDADTDGEMLILLNGIHALTAADFIL